MSLLRALWAFLFTNPPCFNQLGNAAWTKPLPQVSMGCRIYTRLSRLKQLFNKVHWHNNRIA